MPVNGSPEACGLTIGSFDGVHLGHQAIISELVSQCQARQLKSCILTFYPRPAEYFGGDNAAPSLMGWREKVSMLMQMGVDEIICLGFDRSISKLSAQDFVSKLVLEALSTRLVMIGDDFRFGNDRLGDYEMLKRMSVSQGFDLLRSPTVNHGGERISSSRVRAELAAGNLHKASELLGHDYYIQGRVRRGQQLGRKLGAPTANIDVALDRLPMTGVFVVNVNLGNNREVFGVANLGFRPAVDNRALPVLEVHLLDFEENLYGRRLCVSFLQKIRAEKKFESKDHLALQIAKDIDWTRRWLCDRNTEFK
jgi:riboflavin kinase/FMN adenylyltransferase